MYGKKPNLKHFHVWVYQEVGTSLAITLFQKLVHFIIELIQ